MRPPPFRRRAGIALVLALGLIGMMAARPGLAQSPPAAALSQGQLDAVLAPVALYPEALLTPLLMATTYPDEVTAADDWLQKARNARLKGEALAAALEKQPWTPSVKTLVPFPQLVDMLATRPVWMHQIGAAFLAEPGDVMREIQRLRRLALATGKLKTTRGLAVTERNGAIVIAAADPAKIYVPVYNPAVVYGAWAYPAYPPVYIQPPPGFHASGPGMETGVGFSLGFAVIPGLWGWARPDWATGAVTIDTAIYNRINRYGAQAHSATWRHLANPANDFHVPEAAAADLPHAETRRHETRHETRRGHVSHRAARSHHSGKRRHKTHHH